MSAIKDGGPAFPLPGTEWPNGRKTQPEFGISIRDYFAAAALSSIAAKHISTASAAEVAYRFADSMLAEREKVKS